MNLPRILCILVLLGAASAQAEDAPASFRQKKAMCEGCHGLPDYRTAYPEVYQVPKLGAQNAAYLVKALQDYRSGARKHPSMLGIAGDLTDQEISALAASYAGSEAK